MTFNRCKFCKNYVYEPYDSSHCKFCDFDYEEQTDDDWDILDLDDDVEWSHLQILERLHEKDIDCIFADSWIDDNVCFLVGVMAYPERVADALNIHVDTIYSDYDRGIMFINLFQEKCLRNLLFDPTTYNRNKWLNEIRELSGMDDWHGDFDVIQMCISFTLQSLKKDPKCLWEYRWDSTDC